MALINAKEMMIKAKEGKYAVGQFNINNLEWTKAILEVAKENNSPTFLGVSEGAAKYMGGYKAVAGMVAGLVESMDVKQSIALHLDHGTTFESCKAAIDAGFTSVMIDGSHHSIEENVRITKEVVDYANNHNVSVEAEVGIVGGEEDGIVGETKYATLSDCKAIVEGTEIDFLAASLGSVHGHYKGDPVLGFTEMEEISNELNIPLVLHGGSGIPNDMIMKAISCGIAKINVNTEIQEQFTKATAAYFAAGKHEIGKGYDPRKVLAPGMQAIKDTVKDRMIVFGSVNKEQ